MINAATFYLRADLSLTRQHRFKLPQARLDFARLADVAHDGIERLQAVAGDAEDGGIIRRNLARGNEFLGHAVVTPPAGFREDAFVLGEQADAFADFVVGHIVGRAAGFLHHAQRVEAVRRRADGERFRNRVRFDGLEEIQSRLCATEIGEQPVACAP